MIEVQLQVPENVNSEALVRIIEQTCIAHGLNCTSKGTLAGYPGKKGILEITWWELERRLWFRVAQNRTGDWIKDNIPLLKERIEKSLG